MAAKNDSFISVWSVLQILVVVRAIAAATTPISDCDETFNYWEPLHYLIHHRGFQTWEYSPEFALRSYTYLGLHAFPAVASKALGFSSTSAFYATRGFLGLVCAVCETTFIRGVQERFGASVARYSFVFLVSNAGMFLSCTSFLPSTTSMYAVMLGYGMWFTGDHVKGLMCGAFAVLLCWPFAVIMFVPMGFDALHKRGFTLVVGVAVLSTLLFAVAPSVVDSWLFFKRPVVAFWNIVLYNVFGSGGGGQGAELYGSEPWHFYVANLALNHNLAAILGLLGGLVCVVLPSSISGVQRRGEAFVYFVAMYITLGVFTVNPHKEERFLFILYPMLCLGAALTVHCTESLIHRVVGQGLLAKAMVVMVLGASSIVAVARVAAVLGAYSAPFAVYQHLNTLDLHNKVVCVGKEWYRFPTHFMLEDKSVSVQWYEDGFHGLLPQAFGEWPAMASVPQGLNDENKENPDVYVPLETCDYVVDFLPRSHVSRLQQTDKWSKNVCLPFLNAELSKSPWRSIYVPMMWSSESKVVFDDYCVFHRL